MSQKEIKKRLHHIIEFSGLHDFLSTKIYQFSEGMKQRLAFSIAINCNPDVLLLDEVFEVGDEDFKKRSSAKIKEIAKEGGCVLLVSHDLGIIRKYCSHAIWLKDGLIFEQGKSDEIVKKYKELK
jgi:ABC-type polysaccharide/polyol phosphate transport system ATPase subunit